MSTVRQAQVTPFNPLPQLTGGFQEETCHSCHNSFLLNEGRTRGGTFFLSGVPAHYQSGESYPITVVIGQPGQRRWGFELSVRSAASGEQAGRLETVDDRTQLKEAEGIQYVQHNASGTQEGVLNGPVEFLFNWIAPDPSAGLLFLTPQATRPTEVGIQPVTTFTPPVLSAVHPAVMLLP